MPSSGCVLFCRPSGACSSFPWLSLSSFKLRVRMTTKRTRIRFWFRSASIELGRYLFRCCVPTFVEWRMDLSVGLIFCGSRILNRTYCTAQVFVIKTVWLFQVHYPLSAVWAWTWACSTRDVPWSPIIGSHFILGSLYPWPAPPYILHQPSLGDICILPHVSNRL